MRRYTAGISPYFLMVKIKEEVTGHFFFDRGIIG
jgi:hypothetical protein